MWPYWDESDQGGTRFADKSAFFLPLEMSFGRERDVGDCQPCHRPGAHALQHYKPLPPWAPRVCWSAVKTRRRARLPAEWTNIRYPAGFAPNQARTRVTVAHLRGMQALLAGPTRSLKGLLRRSRMMLEKPSEHAAPQAESQGWSFDVYTRKQRDGLLRQVDGARERPRN